MDQYVTQLYKITSAVAENSEKILYQLHSKSVTSNRKYSGSYLSGSLPHPLSPVLAGPLQSQGLTFSLSSPGH